MLDHKAKAYLLEVNHSPSFGCDTPLDKRIKSGLILETMRLMSVHAEAKGREMERERDLFLRRMQRASEQRAEQRREEAPAGGASASTEDLDFMESIREEKKRELWCGLLESSRGQDGGHSGRWVVLEGEREYCCRNGACCMGLRVMKGLCGRAGMSRGWAEGRVWDWDGGSEGQGGGVGLGWGQ